MFKSVIATFMIFSALTLNAYAEGRKASFTAETGKSSITDYTEDRDISGNFDYYRYRLKFEQDLSKTTSYNLAYEYRERDYDTKDVWDSKYNSLQAGFEHTFENFRGNPLKMDIDFGYKTKDYKNSPSSEYQRSNASVNLGYKHEEKWAIYWKNGFANYDYAKDDSNELKLFTKIGGWKKFLDDRFKLASYYKFQDVNRESQSRHKFENIFNVAPSYKLNMPYFKDIRGLFEAGRNDTKDYDEEERDDDLTFVYTKWHVLTEHPLSQSLNSSLKYGQIRRNYFDNPNDYRHWLIENKNKYEIFEDKTKKAVFYLEYQHREADYTTVKSLNYIRNSAAARLSYQAKKNWEVEPMFAYKKYDYSAGSPSSLQQYEVKVDFLKKLSKDSLDLKLVYRYIWKDYKYNNDIQQWMVRAGIDYEF